jgi:hypothetical protein
MASFADYVRDVMEAVPKVNGNPMLSVTSMTDDNARYREDPFYRSREIQARDQLVLDEEERRRLEAALSEAGIRVDGGGDGESIGGAPGASIGQGQNLGAQGLALGLLGYGQYGFAPGAGTAGLLGGLLADAQIDAISAGYGNLGNNVANTGMFSVTDANGNSYTVSNDKSIAAQDAASFGHDSGITGGNSFSADDGMGYNE